MMRKVKITIIVYDKKRPAKLSAIECFADGSRENYINRNDSSYLSIWVPRRHMVHVVLHIKCVEPTREVIVGLGELKANCEYVANLILSPKTQRIYLVELDSPEHTREPKTGAHI